MGLSTALYTGVSGLNANGADLSVIGDNIANTNTIGFKGSRAAFGDILSNALGGGSSMQIGRGVTLQSVTTQFSQGTIQSTSNPLDLAIEGDGFFVVKDASGVQYYTRAGQYKINSDGNIVTPEGMQLQGYLATAGGVLGTINVSSLNSPATPTGSTTDGAVTIYANLSSQTTVKYITSNTSNSEKFFADGSNNTVYANIGGVNDILVTVPSLSDANYNTVELPALKAAYPADFPAAYSALDGYSGQQLADCLNYAFANAKDATTGAAAPISATATYSAATNKFTITNTDAANPLTIKWTDPKTTAEQLFGFKSSANTSLTVSGGLTPSEISTDSSAIGFDPITPTNTRDFQTSITVYDSLGNSHLITVYFRKTQEDTPNNPTNTDKGNTWDWYAVVPKDDDINKTSNMVAAHGRLSFDTSGYLVKDDTGLTNGFNFTGGVEQAQTIPFKFGTSIVSGGSGLDGTTQFGTASSVLFQNQDGNTSGSLQSLIVDQGGAMTGIFTNGKTEKVADVALSRFAAATELTKVGKNLFSESSSSGVPIIGTAGTSGRGNILASSLEASNVDLAAEFVAMIAAQRAFQANTKVITATDELLTELGNIKQ